MHRPESTQASATAADLVRTQGKAHRPQWRAALTALRRLLNEPNRTEYAFEVIFALDGDSAERGLKLMLSQPQGRDLFLARPNLADWLGDRETLSRLPEGSFGRAYLDHIDRYGLDPTKLVELGGRRQRSDPALVWAAERQSLSHDLWHVLSGCGADGPGEAELLAFSYAQNGGRANLLLTLGASSRMWRGSLLGWPGIVWRSYRKGRRAVCLAAAPYEDLLPLPLEDVRVALGLPASRS
jgi:ubiquinone biosynthesis protein COQ4